MAEYIHYTEQELQDARDTDMVDFLERTYCYTFHRIGSYYVCDDHDSLNVEYNRKTWHWNSSETGGLNAIDWLVNIENYTFQEACKYFIQGKSTSTFTKVAPAKIVKEKKPFALPPKTEGKYSNVYMYLTKTRCIDADIVTYCFKNKILYQDKKNNCVFVGFDDNNVARFAECKTTSTERKFRYNVESSSKEFSFSILCDKQYQSDRVFVFEAPIDLLSHIDLNIRNAEKYAKAHDTPFCKDCWQKHNRISLSGSSDIALESFLNRHEEVKKIALCCDNDEAGKKLSDSIIKKYTEKGYIVTSHNATFGKDYNDMLCHAKEQEQVLDNTHNYNQCSR